MRPDVQLRLAPLWETWSAGAPHFANRRSLPTPPAWLPPALSQPKGAWRVSVGPTVLPQRSPPAVTRREGRRRLRSCRRPPLPPLAYVAPVPLVLRPSPPGLLCPALSAPPNSCRSARGLVRPHANPGSFRGNWRRGRCRAAGKQKGRAGPSWKGCAVGITRPDRAGWGSQTSVTHV